MMSEFERTPPLGIAAELHPMQPSSTHAQATSLNRVEVAQSAEQELVRDLQQYPLRTRRTLTLIWLFTGIFGGHRYYLQRVGSGVLMTLTYGGAGVWWVLDGFRLKQMLAAYNGEQNFRRKRGLPPMELDFLPTLDTRVLERRPVWFLAGSIARSTLRWDVAVVAIVGFILGRLTIGDGWADLNLEPLAALLALLVLVNFEPLLLTLRRYRVVQEVLQWYLKLKLYYHQNAVPKPLALLFRPLTGLFLVIFRRRRSGEARLYMELGVVFSVLFSVLSLIQGEYWSLIGKGDMPELVREWLGETVASFFMTYTCLTPIGATFMKVELLQRPVLQRLVLTAATLGALVLGLGSAVA
jgi:hypothetical protein